MVCLCMIVKNESKIIERCLTSVVGIIDSWCIVDTGSTDGTQNIIKKTLSHLPGEVIERPWKNFGHNRSEAVELSKRFGTWALLLDADMVLINNGFEKAMLHDSESGYYLTQENFNIKYKNIRLINLKFDWKCIGVTHEYWQEISRFSKLEELGNLKILDIGDGGSKDNKFTRDIELLVEGLQSEPQNTRYKFYLAQSYKDLGQYPVAISWYQSCVMESKWPEEVWYSKYAILCCMILLKEERTVIESFAVNLWISRPWRAEPLFKLAQFYKKIGDWDQCYWALLSCSRLEYPNDDLLFIEHKLYDGEILDELSVAAYWINKYKESIEIIDGLLQKRYGNIYRERLLKNRSYSEEKIKTQLHESPSQKND